MPVRVQVPAAANIASATPKNKKVVRFGTIVEDLDAPTWQPTKPVIEDVKTLTLDENNFQLSANQDDDDDDS